MISIRHLAFAVLLPVTAFGQDRRCLVDKVGRWSYETNLPAGASRLRNGTLSAADNQAFRDRMAQVALWFRQQYPMIGQPRGYDLLALSRYSWGDFTTRQESEYGIPAELDLLFRLFYASGRQHIVEPPHFVVRVNSITSGHSGVYFTPESPSDALAGGDPTRAAAIERALARLSSIFPVFPLTQQPIPGVNVYAESPGGMEWVVVFNPERPPFWIPVTVREVADASVGYFTLLQRTELDRMLVQQLKAEMAGLTPEELAAPAYLGHDSRIVLKVNGQAQGLALMRFNPAYWNRALPMSAVQLLSYGRTAEPDTAGGAACPDYPHRLARTITWDAIASLIQRR